MLSMLKDFNGRALEAADALRISLTARLSQRGPQHSDLKNLRGLLLKTKFLLVCLNEPHNHVWLA